MRLLTFEVDTFLGPVSRLGIWLDNQIVDLNLAYVSYLASQGVEAPYEIAAAYVPSSMLDFLTRGRAAVTEAEKAVNFIKGHLNVGEFHVPKNEKVIHSSGIRYKAPLRPGKIVHTGVNYREHLNEVGWQPPPIPAAFLKRGDAVIGHEENVIYNMKVTKELDYEIELAAVIGKRCRNVSKNSAYEYVAGYTIFNDITARDIQMLEIKKGNQFVGKNLDTSAPLGPYIVTRDEIIDPHNLNFELRVNGEVRQKSNTKFMIFKIPDLVEYFSQSMTLEVGDVLTTGTPSGTAYFRKDPKPFLLKPGDNIEAEIEKIGILKNRVIAG